MDLFELIVDLFRGAVYWISTFIYKLIIDIYNIFLKLCNSRILDNDVMQIIAQRVGLILGLIMLFILIFSVVQMVLDPDKLTDKEKGIGNIAKKIIIVIVMLGVSQSAFSLLYGVQKTVINSNIIGKFLIPYETDLEQFGGTLSSFLFTSFYRLDENVINNSNVTNTNDINECEIAYGDLLLEISNKNFARGEYCLNKKAKISGEKNSVYIMDLHPLLLPIAGGAALFFLFTYCITVGVRTVQLAFLEIIAPMAIISYLSPKKDTLFSKWWKLYSATYIDVFLRIAIISLAVFLIAVIFSSDMSGTFLDSIGGSSSILINVIMIFAILTFAKKAPDLIKDLFPSSASKLGLGFTTPKKMFDNMLFGKNIENGLKRTAGLGIGAVIGGAGNFVRAMVAKDKNGNPLNWKDKLSTAAGGLWSGAKAGFGAKDVTKSFGASNKAALEQSKRLAEWRAKGGVSAWSRWKTGIQQHLGVQTAGEYDELQIEDLQINIDLYKEAEEEAKSKVIKNRGNYTMKSKTGKVLTLGQLEALKNDQNTSVAERAIYSAEYDKLLDAATKFNLDYGITVKNGEVHFNDNAEFDSMIDATGNIHSSYSDINAVVDAGRTSELGETNDYINLRISKIAGRAKGGRGEAADKAQKRNKGEIDRLKQSVEYKQHKADEKYGPGSKK